MEQRFSRSFKQVPSEELVHFLLYKSCVNNDLEYELMYYFSHYGNSESKSFYKERLDNTIFNYVGKKNYKEWKSIQEVEKISNSILLSISNKI